MMNVHKKMTNSFERSINFKLYVSSNMLQSTLNDPPLLSSKVMHNFFTQSLLTSFWSNPGLWFAIIYVVPFKSVIRYSIHWIASVYGQSFGRYVNRNNLFERTFYTSIEFVWKKRNLFFNMFREFERKCRKAYSKPNKSHEFWQK